MKQPTLLLALSLFAVGATVARAQEADPGAPIAQELRLGSLMEDAELAALSGGESHVQVLTNQNLSAISTGNTVEAGTVVSGDISFTGDALSGFSGIGNFVVNTGHNNTLQGSISVSVVAQ